MTNGSARREVVKESPLDFLWRQIMFRDMRRVSVLVVHVVPIKHDVVTIHSLLQTSIVFDHKRRELP